MRVLDGAVQRRPAIPARLEGHGVALRNAREIALEQRQLDPHGREIGDLERGVVGVDALAALHLHVHDLAVDRRAQLEHAEPSLGRATAERPHALLGRVELRLQRRVLGLCLLRAALRCDALFDEQALAFDVVTRRGRARPHAQQIGLRAAEIGALEAGQAVARRHPITGDDVDLGHASGDARTHRCDVTWVERDGADHLDDRQHLIGLDRGDLEAGPRDEGLAVHDAAVVCRRHVGFGTRLGGVGGRAAMQGEGDAARDARERREPPWPSTAA